MKHNEQLGYRGSSLSDRRLKGSFPEEWEKRKTDPLLSGKDRSVYAYPFPNTTTKTPPVNIILQFPGEYYRRAYENGKKSVGGLWGQMWKDSSRRKKSLPFLRGEWLEITVLDDPEYMVPAEDSGDYKKRIPEAILAPPRILTKYGTGF